MTTEYNEGELPLVLEALERMTNHLTAAIVSNDVNFVQNVLGNSVNGTTYCGIRARTTGVDYRGLGGSPTEWVQGPKLVQFKHISQNICALMFPVF